MGRAMGYLASFFAVVAACVGFVRWLDAKDVPLGVILLVVACAAYALIPIRHELFPQSAFFQLVADKTVSRWSPGQSVAAFAVVSSVTLAVLVGALFLSALRSELATTIAVGLAVAITAGPFIFDLYARDKASRKQCPDCCEEVKVGARVCRYCGHRWTVD